MNENLKGCGDVNSNKSMNFLNIESLISDKEKDKFMEILRSGPENENMIYCVNFELTYMQFELNDKYDNLVIAVDFSQNPWTVCIGKNGLIYIEELILEGFGKKWAELVYKRLPSCRLAGGIHCIY